MTTATNQGASPQNGRIQELSPEDGREFFDREVQRALKISGDEFLANWDAGAYDADPDQSDIMYLAMLIPFAR
jgi:hypothetical protein